MQTFLTEVRQTLFPRGEARHGPLPPLLVAMTLVTGLIDAFSYLALGHVLVANMTGNVIFTGFALAGAPGFEVLPSLVALCAFIAGSMGAGLLGKYRGQHRGHYLSISTGIQSLLLAIAVGLAILAGRPLGLVWSYALIIVLGLAMGLQNATVRKLGVPDLTTTVLTLTIVGMGADSRLVGGSGSKAGRRLIAVIAMFAGALLGAALILHSALVLPLLIALLITMGVALATLRFSSQNPPWVRTT